jgi:hypothetical protein
MAGVPFIVLGQGKMDGQGDVWKVHGSVSILQSTGTLLLNIKYNYVFKVYQHNPNLSKHINLVS